MAAGKDEVTLFSLIYSPFAQRVEISLREKHIPFDTVSVDLSKKPKELLDGNPVWKKVPTLVHNGNAVAESQVILQYIEDAWPEKTPLLPRDAFGKSQMRFWADYVYQFFNTFGPSVDSKPGSPEMEAVRASCSKGLHVLEEASAKFSANGPFFAGDTLGFVDVALAPLLIYLPVLEAVCGLSLPGPDELPRYYKWCDAMLAQPSVKDTLPAKPDAVSFLKKVIENRAASAAAANGN